MKTGNTGERRRRRDLPKLGAGALLASGVAAWPVVGRAQQPAKIPRVGILTAADSDRTPIFDAFRQGLGDLGYVEGRNIILEFRLAHSDFTLLPKLAAELVNLPADIVRGRQRLGRLSQGDPHHPDCGHDGRPDAVRRCLQPVATGWQRHGL